MIIEDYVSFETAKLLKDKGFDEQVFSYYDEFGFSCPTIENKFANLEHFKKPTLQMAMKWLRKVHNLFIEIMVGESEGKTWYDYDIIPVNGKFIYWKKLLVLPPTVECNTPEEAIEIGLKYCLENLI